MFDTFRKRMKLEIYLLSYVVKMQKAWGDGRRLKNYTLGIPEVGRALHKSESSFSFLLRKFS